MSKLSLPLILASALLMTGCADSDADGLSNGKERRLGTDPDVADSDGDGLTDFDEVELHGTDPLLADSDEDTYLDGWEIAEGTDPLDGESRIYKGFWPYNPNKSSLTDPGPSGPLVPGMHVYNHVAVDQFGDQVELFDYLGQGKDVIIDASAVWCGPCRATADWLASGGTRDTPWGTEAAFKKLRKAVDNGKVYWVTILVQNISGGPTVRKDVKEWDADYPHENVPVIADPDSTMLEATVGTTGFFPTGMLLSPEGEVLYIGGMSEAMALAQDRL